MEAKSTATTDNVTPEGENHGRMDYWVAPEIAAAMAGETVDFSKDVSPREEADADTNV